MLTLDELAFDLRVSFYLHMDATSLWEMWLFGTITKVLTRARLRRRLFYWTKTMRVGISELSKEANPFDLRNLRRWLSDASREASTRHLGELGQKQSTDPADYEDDDHNDWTSEDDESEGANIDTLDFNDKRSNESTQSTSTTTDTSTGTFKNAAAVSRSVRTFDRRSTSHRSGNVRIKSKSMAVARSDRSVGLRTTSRSVALGSVATIRQRAQSNFWVRIHTRRVALFSCLFPCLLD